MAKKKDPYAGHKTLKFDRPAKNVLRVTLNRPEVFNAVNPTMHEELINLWAKIDKDDETSVVILCGAGKAFSAGADINDAGQIYKDFNEIMRTWRGIHDHVYNFINFSKPVVSAMHNVAVGAGLTLGVLSDVVIVSPELRIIDGHTRVGVTAGDHSAMIWPILCGMAKAKYYLLSSKPLMGDEAERIGVATFCVPLDELQDKAVEVAKDLAMMPPTAVRTTKYSLNNWLRTFGPHLDASLGLEMLGWTGHEAQEGVKSLQEKRNGNWDPYSPM